MSPPVVAPLPHPDDLAVLDSAHLIESAEKAAAAQLKRELIDAAIGDTVTELAEATAAMEAARTAETSADETRGDAHANLVTMAGELESASADLRDAELAAGTARRDRISAEARVVTATVNMDAMRAAWA